MVDLKLQQRGYAILLGIGLTIAGSIGATLAFIAWVSTAP